MKHNQFVVQGKFKLESKAKGIAADAHICRGIARETWNKKGKWYHCSFRKALPASRKPPAEGERKEKENSQVQHSVYIGKEKLICSWVVLKDETVIVDV
jgi:predicted transposase YbfD/YdcC